MQAFSVGCNRSENACFLKYESVGFLLAISYAVYRANYTHCDYDFYENSSVL